MMEEEAIGPFSQYQTIWRFTQLLDKGVGNCDFYKSQIQLIDITQIPTAVNATSTELTLSGKNRRRQKKDRAKKIYL
jgi:hypothetical protein